ncbi:GntR family transcriptional regulator [Leucobacter sp. gxy201]|uniref:GntR family transcriptional regulator n=1 Tax=Leucobacter sp. gxy201 TaxID=2957200 RepID=UPI003DA0058A
MTKATSSARELGRAASGARRRIMELIDSGVYPPGSKLPGERELAVAVGVSRAVLRDALGVLADEQQLEASPWRGWFVTAPHMEEKVDLLSFTEMAEQRGLRAGAEVIDFARRAATLEEARRLRLAPGDEVFDLVRLRTLNENPACVDYTVMPVALMPSATRDDFVDASLYAVLEARSAVVIVRSDYAVRAEGAAAEDAGRLGIDSGSPVLVGEETAGAIDGVPRLLGRVVYRPDAYEFHATLFRSVGA